ncbi:calponin homology domain-containing protein DDB_G0272472 isoform X2 [Herrania umbratica]|uniref:Calponin homology domain-containing protein DDB_G0272472 isoform X2 n=1 Tax=Herrania umbratica TaxID=108875 RepID=A0A6J1AL58_9ROSI|nr:calponin homology domain-containing protein DDB_G0272472 isoform X2 [Herrania umbratica]
MTAEEVTVVHVAEEEVASSSSKVEIVVEKDKEEEKQKENDDLSNGANGSTVKEEGDGDGDGYVFVNGDDAVHGDSVESDLEKNGIGIGGEDQGVENLDIKGEVESESDLVKDLEGEDGSCIEIVDQNKESTELCHVEGPVVEDKPEDLIETGPVSAIDVEDGVSETSRANQNGVSESPEIVSDSNGDGSANGVAKQTVSEATAVDSSGKQSDEVSSVSVSDSNGGSLANDSVEDSVVDSRSKANEDSETAVADDGDSNGGSLANDSFRDSVVDSRSQENEDSETAVPDDGDSNGDALATDSAKDTVSEGAVGSDHEQNGVSELPVSDDGVPPGSVSDSNGDGLPNDSAKDTVSEAVVTDSGAEQNDGVPLSVSDSNGNCLPADNVEDTVSEVSKPEQNDGVPVSVSDPNGDCLPAESVEDIVSEVSKPEQNESSNIVEAEADCHGLVYNGNGDRTEQNGLSEMPETVHPDNESVKSEEDLTARDEVPVQGGLDLEGNSEQGLSPKTDADLEKDTVSGSISDERGEALQDDHTQGCYSETVVINDSVDSSQNSQQGQSSEIVESTPSPVTDENVTVERGFSDTTADSNIGTGASADVVERSPSTVALEKVTVESGVVDNAAETLPSSTVDDEKAETEVVKSDENSRGASDSHHVEDSEVKINVVNGSVDDGTKVSCLANGLKSETKINSDSIVSEEAGVSTKLAEDSIEPNNVGDQDEKLAVADVQKDSSLAASLRNDEKAPPAVENFSAVSNRDITGNDGTVHESGLSNSDTNGSEQNCAVINEGTQSSSVANDGKTCKEQEGIDEVERKRPFYFLIRVPRYDDEDLKEKIRLAQIRVDEKTQSRDAIRIEMQSKRATCKEYGDNFDAAISQERAARDLLRSKRQEIDSIQSVINIDDIDGRIRNMEHMIQHETLPLKEEKQLVREINQLKQVRDQLSSNRGRHDEVQQGSDQKEETEKRLKSLKKEVDQLKDNLLKAEAVTKAAKKKYYDETEKYNKLLSQFKAADDIRQEAYAQLQGLKKQSYEKNKYFWQYRDDAKTANDLALKGDKEALQNLCLNQVERVMDFWNNNGEFRKEYMRCNVRSTLRRLRTMDGRALGPDEEPTVIPQVVHERVAKDHTVSRSTLEERIQEKPVLAKAEKANDKPVTKAVEQKSQTSKSEKSVKSVHPVSGSTTASSRDEIEEAREEKPKRTKEEEELARKAEELRKAEEAAKLREQRRLEEIAKAKEAQERKRRIAEKAQVRAALRAQKEAEQKEKEREKRARKKERRKVATAAAGDANAADEVEPAPAPETPTETPKESENKEKPVILAKRPQKPSQFTKQSKAKSIPPPLRNRGKRRMQPWMWVLLTTLVIFALFLVGNGNFFSNFGLQRFNF